MTLPKPQHILGDFDPINRDAGKISFEKKMADLFGCNYVDGVCQTHGVKNEHKGKTKRKGGGRKKWTQTNLGMES